MEIRFTQQAKEDRDFWKKSGNAGVMKRISTLLHDIAQHPHTGIGKPERLKYECTGMWLRRINAEHRIVYMINEAEQSIDILALRYHYSK